MWPGRPMTSSVTVLVHLWIHFVVFVGNCPSRFFVGRFSRPFGFCGPGSSGGRLWVAWQLMAAGEVRTGSWLMFCFVVFFSDSQHVPATPVVNQEPLSLQSSRIRGWASAGLQGFKHHQEHLLYFGCHAVIDHLFKYVPWVMRMPHGMHMVYAYLHTFRSSGRKGWSGMLLWVSKVQSHYLILSPEILFAAHIQRLFFDHIFGILTMTTYDYNDSVGQASGFVIHWFDLRMKILSFCWGSLVASGKRLQKNRWNITSSNG